MWSSWSSALVVGMKERTLSEANSEWLVYDLKMTPVFLDWVILHKKQDLCLAWMDLEGIMLSEISHGAKDKYHMISPFTGT